MIDALTSKHRQAKRKKIHVLFRECGWSTGTPHDLLRVLIRTKVLFDTDQGIWAGLNPFEHSIHPALGLSLRSSTIDGLVEVHGVPSFDYNTYKVNIFLSWIDRKRSIL